MEIGKIPRRSLKQRCMGPRATSIRALVRRADAAVEQVVRDFSFHARGRLEDLRRLADAALADSQDAEKWAALQAGLRDLQTSSAMAAAPWISRFAAGLQGELAVRDAGDRHLPVLMALHLDAIRVAASEAPAETQLAELDKKLEHASQALRH